MSFSQANIHYMDSFGYDFVIMVKGLKALVKEAILTVQGTFENLRNYSIRKYRVNGITVRKQLYPSDENQRYFHIYYDPGKSAAERMHLEDKLSRMEKILKRMEGKPYELDKPTLRYYRPEYYNEGKKDQCFVTAYEREEVVEEELSLCGYFCIISSAEMTAREALELYKSRDASEKLFRADKSFLGGKTERVQTEEGLGGKLLIGFVSLIIRNRMYTKIKDAAEEMDSTPNFMNVAAAIRELEKIEMLRGIDGVYRLDHAITKNQRIILNAFDINTNDVKSKADEISEQLKPRLTTAS